MHMCITYKYRCQSLSLRDRNLCDSAARSQRMSLSLSLSTCTRHAGMVHSHLHGMHLHIHSLTPVYMSKKTSLGKTGMRLPRMLHSKQQRVPILNTPHSKTHAHLTKNRWSWLHMHAQTRTDMSLRMHSMHMCITHKYRCQYLRTTRLVTKGAYRCSFLPLCLYTLRCIYTYVYKYMYI